MTEDEFWTLSPPQFYALQERWYLEQQRRDFRTGVLTAIVANLFVKKGRKPFKPTDFMSFREGTLAQATEGPRRQTVEQQLSIVSRLNVALGGKDIRSAR